MISQELDNIIEQDLLQYKLWFVKCVIEASCFGVLFGAILSFI